MSHRTLLWAARLTWAALPVAAGPALGAAMNDWPTSARTAATAGLWGAWLVTLVATLVPHPIALTVWRVIAPAAAIAVVWAALDGQASALAAIDAGAAAALAFAAPIARQFVNGPAYPNERRFPLRPPAVALVGPALLAWVVLVGGPAAAVLLLAQQRWEAGGAVAVAGGACAVLAARALHGLSRRWLVFVPAGIVVHDPLTLADPTLFPRAAIAGLGPALADGDTGRLDLTAGALGLALELRLGESTGVLAIAKPGPRPTAETVTTTTLLIAPTRAAAVLTEAAERGYRVY
jgi:hypothetical protein